MNKRLRLNTDEDDDIIPSPCCWTRELLEFSQLEKLRPSQMIQERKFKKDELQKVYDDFVEICPCMKSKQRRDKEILWNNGFLEVDIVDWQNEKTTHGKRSQSELDNS